jgi:enoyl-CoA hydratase/carnithine racemase
MAEVIALERNGHVATLRLMRTDKHNAFNRALSAEVMAALDELEADSGAHAVILTGSRRAFCAGADMNEAVAAIEERGRNDGMAATIVRAGRFPKPLIAAVNGSAYGGGALLAIMCDIRIASDAAAFRFPGAAYGLVVGGSQLPRVVGPAYAKELLFSGRVVDATEALRIGLVNRVVAPADLERVTMELAQQIAANSPEAILATKEAVDRATEVDDGIRVEAEANAKLRGSAEHHERFRAAAERVAKRGSGEPPRDAGGA